MIDVKRAAEILGESEAHVRRLLKEKRIPSEKIKNKFQIQEADVVAYRTNNPIKIRKVEPEKGTWAELGHQPAVSKLCDDGTTRFWNEHTQNLSNHLPLYSAEPLERQSQYIKSAPLTHIRHLGKTEICTEPTMEYAESAVKTKTIFIRPPKIVGDIWKLWMRETSRIYNTTKNYLAETENSRGIDRYVLRDRMKKINRSKSYPDTAFQYAVLEAQLAHNAGEAKDRTSGTFSVDGRCIENGFIYPDSVRRAVRADVARKYEIELQAARSAKRPSKRQIEQVIKQRTDIIFAAQNLTELFLLETESVCKISYDKLKKTFKLHVPIPVENKKCSRKHFVSLDPGIRTFMTYFDGQSHGEIGAGFAQSMEPLMKAAGRLKAKIKSTANKKKKKSYKRAKKRIKAKITNKTKDLHYKAINFLGQYENIFLPSFPVKQLAAKSGHGTNRRMYALSHFTFKLRLAAKTAEFHNKVIICNEAYTSKTCTRCGKENHKLDDKKIFECDCGIMHDRDYNGARNIALRVLTQAISANRVANER